VRDLCRQKCTADVCRVVEERRKGADSAGWPNAGKGRHSGRTSPPSEAPARSRTCSSDYRLGADIVEKAVKYSPDGKSSPCFGDGLEGLFGRRLGRHPGRYAASITGSIFIGLSRASRLRFWAVAARRNSSLAPFGPLNRRRVRRSIRLRWANSISIFFRRRQACAYSGVEACARATSRASSCRSRGILRARAFGQHWALSLQVSQSNLLAR
jgi:hypothetical protein